LEEALASGAGQQQLSLVDSADGVGVGVAWAVAHALVINLL
tara:strand:- start:257 stop:379 length:123 start_codon:yes stop_codon:yes gene_type:complete